MSKEELFKKTLVEIKDLARKQGNVIEKEQVFEAFKNQELTEEQLTLVFNFLQESRIGVGEKLDDETFLTDEEKDYIKEYKEEIDALPPFTDGEKKACIISCMAGDPDAFKKLPFFYLNDVYDIAKLYTGQGVFLEDLIGEGNLAVTFGATMLGSMETPDEADGLIGKMIMDSMETLIAEKNEDIKADKKIEEKVNKVFSKAKDLSDDLGRKITVSELSEESGLSEKYIRDAIRMSGFKIEEIEDL